MKGAEALLRTLAAGGVDTLIANPGTTEIDLVAALDRVPSIRPVLALFEGVATGAADGYGRMRRRPAATLLHLGPGLANGLANLHNARRAGSPVVNLVGDHATRHRRLDAPLTSDIEGLARPMSHWVRTSSAADTLAADAAFALEAALSGHGHVATLVVPADHAWSDVAGPAEPRTPPAPPPVGAEALERARAALASRVPTALLLGGPALEEPALAAAGRIAERTGCRLLLETFPARVRRGAGIVAAERLPYFAEAAAALLEPLRYVILAGAAEPVAFFAHPGLPGRLVPDHCDPIVLGQQGEDLTSALEALAELLGATAGGATPDRSVPAEPSGALTVRAMADSIARHLPDDVIVADESATAGGSLWRATEGGPPHDWLTLTGGSIGQGLPVATGAALACPDRRILCLQGDGGAMYTPQALWTQAREDLDVVTVILSNRRYAILELELARLEAGHGARRGRALLDLAGPPLDWVALASAEGVPGERAESAEAFDAALGRALAGRGPRLIEAAIEAGPIESFARAG